MKKYKVLLSFFLSMGSISMQAQAYGGSNFDATNLIKPNYSLPSPEAMKLYQYLGYPVSPATGLIDIDIPLFNLKYYNCILPCSLKYHSSGIRIQDEPGSVGLGWSLSPGCRISRIVMGKPDDGVFQINDSIISEASYAVSSPSDESNFKTLLRCRIPASVCDDGYHPLDNQIGYLRYDTQPDIFTIYLPNHSVSFIIRNDYRGYQVEPINCTPLRIEPLTYKPNVRERFLAGFKVTDDNGCVYYFGEDPASMKSINNLQFVEPKTGNGISSNNTWVLRKIEVPQGTVNFSYQLVSYTSNFVPETMSINDLSWNKDYNAGVPISACQEFTGGKDYSIQKVSTHSNGASSMLLLKGIDCPEFSCKFTYSSVLLQGIDVTNKKGSGNKVKEIKFFHSEDKKFLDKLYISGEGYYTFSYNHQNGEFNDKAIDWWGYFNGEVNQTSNLPSVSFRVRTSRYGGEQEQSAGNRAKREPNETAMQAKSLKRITYPTGGYLNISYEANRNKEGEIWGGLRVKSEEIYDPVSSKTITKRYTYENPQMPYTNEVPKDLTSESLLCFVVKNNRTVSGGGVWSIPIAHGEVRARTLSTFSSVMGITTPAVYYTKVTETTSNHKTIYTFDGSGHSINYSLSGAGSGKKGYYPGNIYQYVTPAPELLSKTTCDPQGNKLQEEKYTYSVVGRGVFRGVYIIPYRHYVRSQTDFEWTGCDDSSMAGLFTISGGSTYKDVFGQPFVFNTYQIQKGTSLLASKTITEYAPQGNIVTKEQYDFHKKYGFLKKSRTLTDDKNGTYVERYYYPCDELPARSSLTSVETGAQQKLEQNNYVSKVMQTELLLNNTRLWSKVCTYQISGNRLCTPINIYSQKGNGSYIKRLEYNRFDSNGNPTLYTFDGLKNIIFWQGQYPAAEIVPIRTSVSYDQLLSNYTTFTKTINVESADYKAIKNALPTYFPNCVVTLYVTNPQIGLVRKILPTGESLRYNYDDEQRLKSIVNGDGKTLESFQYNTINK